MSKAVTVRKAYCCCNPFSREPPHHACRCVSRKGTARDAVALQSRQVRSRAACYGVSAREHSDAGSRSSPRAIPQVEKALPAQRNCLLRAEQPARPPSLRGHSDISGRAPGCPWGEALGAPHGAGGNSPLPNEPPSAGTPACGRVRAAQEASRPSRGREDGPAAVSNKPPEGEQSRRLRVIPKWWGRNTGMRIQRYHRRCNSNHREACGIYAHNCYCSYMGI